MTSGERQKLRDAAIAAMAATPPRTAVERVLGRWELQTSNSFRRIGCHGDGDVLCGTKHPIDSHPDLLAKPAVLDYIVAAQPRTILALLDDLDTVETRLETARAINGKIAAVETKLTMVASVVAAVSTAAATLADPEASPEAVTQAQAIVAQLASSLKQEASA